MKPRSLIYFTLAVLFFYYTYWVSTQESLGESFSYISELQWGKLMLVDLYLGFFVFGSLVYILERSFIKVLMWMLPSMILGNGVSLVYVAIKLTKKKL